MESFGIVVLATCAARPLMSQQMPVSDCGTEAKGVLYSETLFRNTGRSRKSVLAIRDILEAANPG